MVSHGRAPCSCSNAGSLHLSAATALLHPQAPRHPSQLGAKKRDYFAGGLGSSKQEQFARLWRDKDAPVAAPEKTRRPREAEIAALDAAAELVPDAHWRDKGRAAVVEDVSKKAITNERRRPPSGDASMRGSTAVRTPRTTPGSTWTGRRGR